jgi:hypothetical protein
MHSNDLICSLSAVWNGTMVLPGPGGAKQCAAAKLLQTAWSVVFDSNKHFISCGKLANWGLLKGHGKGSAPLL